MIKQLVPFLFILFIISCSSDVGGSAISLIDQLASEEKTVEIDQFEVEELSNCVDSVFATYGLVSIQSIDSSILVDLKYASTDNFMHQQLYFIIDQLYLQQDVAERLSRSQAYLQQLHPNYSLLVYDGVRPVDVQKRMWDALDSIPIAERGKFVSNPKNHSVHNYGAAIDLTIVDENQRPLDMGTGYDDSRKIAYPSLEQQYLASGELSKQQVDNRKLLRKVMSHQGFLNIPSEWWHFNAYTRAVVKQRYKVVLEEPKCN